MANWKYVKIGDVCTVERGGSPRPIDKFITDDPNGINWIKIGDTDDSMYITKTAQKIIPEGMKKSRYVQPGDFLLSNSMSFGRPYILKIDGCIHDGWLVLRDNNGIFDKRFLYYYLSAPSTYQKFKNMAVGGVVNNLNSEMVRGVTVPVPTMEEQLNIVVTLDKVTELIALRKEQLAKLDRLVKSRFIELFGDPKTNNKEWRMNTFADICTVRQGLQIPISKRLTQYEEGCYEYITVAYLHGSKEQEYIKNPKSTVICTEEDVLMTRTGNTGMVITNVAGAFHNNFFLIDFDRTRYNKVFLVEYLNLDLIQAEIKRRAGTSTIPDLNHGEFYAISIYEPPVELQKQFAAFVEQTDKSKMAIQQSLDKLELLKKSLMQEYFG